MSVKLPTLMELDPKQDPFSREAIQHLVARYGSPLLIIDAERVRQQYRRLAAALPGVDLHYALKPLPHASLILHVEKTDTGLNVKRELEEGWFQQIELPTPAVLTIQSGGNKLRYATLMGIKKAKTKEVRQLTTPELDSALGVHATAVVVLDRVTLPQKQKSTQMLPGSPKEAAAALVEKLKFEVRVL